MIIVLGDGGHAQVAIDCFGQTVAKRVLPPGATLLHEDQIDETDAKALDPISTRVINGLGFLGGTNKRAKLYDEFRSLGFGFVSVVDSSAIVRPSAKLADGVQILIGVVLNSHCSIGSNTIVNTRAVIEHHVVVGANCHIAPNATICGAAIIGESVFIGAGATVMPEVSIPSGSIVGAGAVVTRSFDAAAILVGVPARPVST